MPAVDDPIATDVSRFGVVNLVLVDSELSTVLAVADDELVGESDVTTLVASTCWVVSVAPWLELVGLVSTEVSPLVDNGSRLGWTTVVVGEDLVASVVADSVVPEFVATADDVVSPELVVEEDSTELNSVVPSNVESIPVDLGVESVVASGNSVMRCVVPSVERFGAWSVVPISVVVSTSESVVVENMLLNNVLATVKKPEKVVVSSMVASVASRVVAVVSSLRSVVDEASAVTVGTLDDTSEETFVSMVDPPATLVVDCCVPASVDVLSVSIKPVVASVVVSEAAMELVVLVEDGVDISSASAMSMVTVTADASRAGDASPVEELLAKVNVTEDASSLACFVVDAFSASSRSVVCSAMTDDEGNVNPFV